MAVSYSPLRYPGGKSRLANFMKLVIQTNKLQGGVYVEPFAGGAGVALTLLLDGYVEQIIINDIDISVYAFWHSVLYNTEALCEKIVTTPVTMDEWYLQKQLFTSKDPAFLFDLGFATFFLNRTNRSGILNAGVIGGKYQTGEWKIDARYPKEKLIAQIRHLAQFREAITLYNLDARALIQQHLINLPNKSLVYLDPPYFQKGQKLYLNALQPNDHILIAHSVNNHINTHWIVSYDNVEPIHALYSNHRKNFYPLSYTAANRYHGSEVVIYSDNLKVPTVDNPFRLTKKGFENQLNQCDG
ncbi:MAG: DNA adenine methylase [Methylobacter sp.]|jgi:DNA adenine methylase|nr:DNA adenine methylase [Methylobacter sp.]